MDMCSIILTIYMIWGLFLNAKVKIERAVHTGCIKVGRFLARTNNGTK
jgi:hypothetical protein